MYFLTTFGQRKIFPSIDLEAGICYFEHKIGMVGACKNVKGDKNITANFCYVNLHFIYQAKIKCY